MISLMFLLCSCSLFAQDPSLHPMLSAGRSWNYVRTHADGSQDRVALMLAEGAAIRGERAYILTYSTPEGTAEKCRLQESGSEVYRYDLRDDSQWQMLANCYSEMGSAAQEWWSSDGMRTLPLPGTLRVQDEVEAGDGIVRMRWHFFRDREAEPADIWVSGIGSMQYGILFTAENHADIVGDDVLALESCTNADGRVLFRAADFTRPRIGEYAYRPLLEDRKVWYCASYRSGVEDLTNPNAVNFYFQYFTEGDTLVSGIRCHKVYGNNHYRSGRTEYLCAMYEQEGKVWCFEDGSAEASLLYDFTMENGDEITVAFSRLGIQRRTATKVGDTYYRNEEGEWHVRDYDNMGLVEGVGPSTGLLMPMLNGLVGGHFELLLCTVGGAVVFNSGTAVPEEVMAINLFYDDKAASTANAAVYDLQGRKIQSNNKVTGSQGDGQLPRGVYIQNGRKVVVR